MVQGSGVLDQLARYVSATPKPVPSTAGRREAPARPCILCQSRGSMYIEMSIITVKGSLWAIDVMMCCRDRHALHITIKSVDGLDFYKRVPPEAFEQLVVCTECFGQRSRYCPPLSPPRRHHHSTIAARQICTVSSVSSFESHSCHA